MIATFLHPVVGSYRGVARAIRFGDGTQPTPRAAPAFAEHSESVLAGEGYSAHEIAQLRSLGAIA
jgi:crotonobetainyl-CoA:carnitine CoA-transferase CaiB-like acyl-CoA transferase